MLVAALAGGAILLAVALVIFSGGDDADAKDKGDDVSASASSAARSSKAGSGSAFKARIVDDANLAEGGEGRADSAEPAAETKAPVKAHRSTRAFSEGMAAAPVDKGPPEFENKEAELKWWNRQLDGAKSLKTRRERQMAKLPELEAKISESNNPEKARESFERKRERLEEAMQRSHDKIAELEAKIAGL